MQTYEETVRDAFVFLFPHLVKAVAAGAKWWDPEIMRWSSYKATSAMWNYITMIDMEEINNPTYDKKKKIS